MLAAVEPTWLIAEIIGTARVLGRWQRRGSDRQAVRRLAGGRTVEISDGAILVLCALPRWDALGAPDVDRVINRQVRPLRSALSSILRSSVAYLGRDTVVSASRQDLAWIGQVVEPHGATLVEALVTAPVPFDDFARALAAAAGGELAEGAAALGDHVAEDDDAGYFESGAVAVPIGLAEALVRHDGATIVSARFRGDVHGTLDALGAALSGRPLEEADVSAELSSALRQPQNFVFGVRDVAVLASRVVATREVALAGLAEKYAVLAALRTRRDGREASGLVGFDEEEHAARGHAFRTVAARFPGALRELEAHSAATLTARAQAVERARATGGPVRDPWIRVVLDFHGTLAAALSERRRTGATQRPRPRILDLVFDELARRHRLSPAELEEMVFGAARRHRRPDG